MTIKQECNFPKISDIHIPFVNFFSTWLDVFLILIYYLCLYHANSDLHKIKSAILSFYTMIKYNHIFD
jgi:hypothetical protein